MYVQWWRNYNDRRSGRDFTARRSWTKPFLTIAWTSNLSPVECLKSMQRNEHSFTVFLKWTRRVTQCLSLVPLRKGVDVYRASNSRARSAVEGLVLRGGVDFHREFEGYKTNLLSRTFCPRHQYRCFHSLRTRQWMHVRNFLWNRTPVPMQRASYRSSRTQGYNSLISINNKILHVCKSITLTSTALDWCYCNSTRSE
jgi:hypothetical protein